MPMPGRGGPGMGGPRGPGGPKMGRPMGGPMPPPRPFRRRPMMGPRGGCLGCAMMALTPVLAVTLALVFLFW